MTKSSWIDKVCSIKTMKGLIDAENQIIEEIRLLDNAIAAYEMQKEMEERNDLGTDFNSKKIEELLGKRSDIIGLLITIYDHSGFIDCGMNFD